MDRKQFWELIEHTHRISNGDPENQAKLLIAKLTELSEKEIVSYQDILDDLMDEAYIAELWEMAYIIDAGCSDDGFMDFRAWLIGQGKHVFETAQTNAESLIDVVEAGQETKSEALLYVAMKAYELHTGKDIDTMPKRVKPLPKLKGKSSQDDDSMLARFPKATTKFWKWWQDYYGMNQG